MPFIHQLFWIGLLLGIQNLLLINCLDPKFDPSTRMKLVLIPADAAVGSVIYRLRATDEEFDYPLQFELIGDASSSTVQIESLPCTKYNSVCQANVLLERRLEPGRYYDFQVLVKDTKGGMATQLCSITATNFTTPHDVIFPHRPGIIMIPENAKRGTELDYVITRKNPLYGKPVYLELWGSPLFAIRQKIVSIENTEGTVFLLGPLDFEKQAMYHLTILANDAYAEPGQDTRNIAGLEVVVIVQDVQDVPPIFTKAPPVTKLPSGLLPGDKILQVHAEDGDKGNPREIRYGLVSEGNPFTSFFDINDTTGEVFLVRPIEDIMAITHSGDPVLLTVIAEEVKVMRDEPPAMATTVQLAFFLPEPSNSPPYFENDHYISRIDENSPQGHALTFMDPFVPRVYDDDTGKNGVFSLTLLNNNGTFEISPNVAERNALFLIRVRDNSLLDYEERKSVEFQILAQELGPATNLSASVNVTVYINDVNDNPPIFTKSEYEVDLAENITAGTKVIEVHADDIDTGMGGRVRYTQILGYLNTSLYLDAMTGVITISKNNHGFDREAMPEYHLYIEARDNEGTGNRAQVPLILKIIDVNDETPIFEKSVYEFILSSDLKEFTSPAFIKAIDNDATSPNNEIRYEIINGNYENKFHLDKITGQITIKEKLILKNYTITDDDQTLRKRKRKRRKRQQSQQSAASQQNNYELNRNIFILTARAYDLGVPVRFSMTTIRIHPPESRTRTITFVVPGYNPDRRKTEEILSALTGGKVVINDIRPLGIDEPGTSNLGGSIKERSVVTATVFYDKNSVVDIAHIQQRLSQYNDSFAIMTREDQNQILYKAENKYLFWALILLAILIAFTILTLLFCCICSWCPLYGATSKRVINVNKTEDDVHLVHTKKAYGQQTKSVQVAEWMGRREAWSTEKSSDSRTKPTRWEFSKHSDYGENVIADEQQRISNNNNNNNEVDKSRRKVRSADERKVKIRNNIRDMNTVKDTHFYNSRTNLINDQDVYVEDIDEHHTNKIYKHDKRKKINEQNQIDDDSIRRHEIDRGSDILDYERTNSFKRNHHGSRQQINRDREYYIKDGNIEIMQLKRHNEDDVDDDDDGIYANVPTIKATSLNNQQPHLIMLDNSGKEILMRRFIEEQPDGKQIIREQYQIVPGATYIQSMPNEIQQQHQHSTVEGEATTGTNIGDNVFHDKSGPNSVAYSQFEPEIRVVHAQQPTQKPISGEMLNTQMFPTDSNQSLHRELETSLKQQNALLRQILLEKEKLEERYSQREIALETQSLPCQSTTIATQTDCEAGTQTDDFPFVGGTERRRRARSENDDSMSDDEYEYIRYTPTNSPNGVYWIKKRRQKKKLKYRGVDNPRKRIVMVEQIKRKIKTPIKEESDEVIEQKLLSPTNGKKPHRSEVKSKVLKRIKNGMTTSSSPAIHRKPVKSAPLNKEILMEISDSLNDYDNTEVRDRQGQSRIRVKEVAYYENSTEDDESDDDEDEDNDDDDDEIVIKRNLYSGNVSPNLISDMEDETKNRLEIHVTDARNRGLLSRRGIMLSEASHLNDDDDFETEYQRRYSHKNFKSSPPVAKTSRLSRKDIKNNKNKEKKNEGQQQRQSISEPPLIGRTPKRPAPKPPIKKDQSYHHEPDESYYRHGRTQSEVDLTQNDNNILEKDNFGDGVPRNTPRYMDWYYNKKDGKDSEKLKVSDDQKSDGQKGKGNLNKKMIGVSEKKIKSRFSKSGDQQHHQQQQQQHYLEESGKKKPPEPTPRKSLPKTSRFLKEDIMTTKNLESRLEVTADTNHPLLQHSQYRYEREYDQAPEISIPPTKVPHYMYPETPPFESSKKTKKISSISKTSPIKENEVSISKTTIYVEDNGNMTAAAPSTSQQNQSKQLNVSTLEDDHDSGIVMNSLLNSMGKRNPIADKKSVFTIAYDEVSRVKKIQSGSDSPQLS